MFDAAHYTHPRKFSLAPAIRVLLKQGVGRADIATRTGATSKYIADVARAAGAGREYHASRWTTELEAELTKLTEGGMTAYQIGAELGFTRNAVIGKWNRLGLKPTHQSNGRHIGTEPRLKYKTPKRKYVRQRFVGDGGWKISVAKAVIEVPKIVDAEIPPAQRKTVMELENHHCRWPVGEVGQPGFFFCGAPTAGLITDRPYCPAHMHRAWTTRPMGGRTNYSIKQMKP